MDNLEKNIYRLMEETIVNYHEKNSNCDSWMEIVDLHPKLFNMIINNQTALLISQDSNLRKMVKQYLEHRKNKK